jgi:hypothetical protein
MKLHRVLLAAGCVGFLYVAPATAQSVFTELTAIETFAAQPIEGVVNCRGQVLATGNFYVPCGLGVPGTIRGRQIFYLETVPGHPELNGLNTVVANINFDENAEGRMWGTFEWILLQPPGGSFAGTFAGTVNLTSGALQVKLVGHGQGDVEGLQAKGDDVHTEYLQPGVVTFRLFNPGGKN